VTSRLLALVFLLAVLPTVEVTEQLAHVVEHVVAAEVPDHSAHHDDGAPGDEHGCTGLIHLCSCHHTQVTANPGVLRATTVETQAAPSIGAPSVLVDKDALEPPHCPPIG
jgi:hypothetical protein